MENLFLLEPENAKALAGAINSFLEQPAMAAQMGQAGRSRALEDFGWDHYVATYEALYQRLVKKC